MYTLILYRLADCTIVKEYSYPMVPSIGDNIVVDLSTSFTVVNRMFDSKEMRVVLIGTTKSLTYEK